VLRVIEVHDSYAKLQALGQDLSKSVQIPMAAASGDDFVCFLPGAEKDIDSTVQGKKEGSSSEEIERLKAVEEQLESLRGTCTIARNGFWSYKVCPFQSIEQIHFEGNSNTMSFSLGSFTTQPSKENTNEAETEAAGDHDDDGNKNKKYVITQHFEGGSQGRSCQLHFVCKPSASEAMTVTKVEEMELLEYKIVVETPLACPATKELKAKRMLDNLSGLCFRRTEGWWTYEVCHGDQVRQFHKEKNGDLTEFSLGQYDREGNEALENNGNLLVHDKTSSRPSLQQVYTDGTKCDLKDTKRTTTVMYTCTQAQLFDMGGSASAGILSILESPSCNYVVVVHVPVLCAHPFFNKGDAAVSSSVTAKLHCVPKSALASRTV